MSTTRVNVIRRILHLSKEVKEVITIVHPSNGRVVTVPVRCVHRVNCSERMATRVLHRRFTIRRRLAFTRGNLRVRGGFLPFRDNVKHGVLTVPSLPLMVSAAAHLNQRVFSAIQRKSGHPIFVVGFFYFHAFRHAFVRTPNEVRQVSFPPTVVRTRGTNYQGLQLPNYPRKRTGPSGRSARYGFLRSVGVCGFSLDSVLVW